MRRALNWMAAAGLAAAICALLLLHARPGATALRMNAPEAAGRVAQRPPALPAGQVNPNLADVEELQTLPGVGQAIAERMIREREQNGPFHYPEDLLCVSGIGQKTLLKLYDQLCMSE